MAKKKIKKVPGERTVDGNVILFTALSMILLAFFIVLNSIAVVDQNRKLEALGSLIGSFGILPGGVLMEPGDTILPYESPIVTSTDTFENAMSRMEKYIVDYQFTSDLTFTYDERNLKISISSELLFSNGTDKLNQKTLPFLNLVTRLAGTVDNKLRIEGHLGIGEVIIDGNVDAMDFSLLRAIRVMEHMIRKGDLLPERFSVGGYGHEKPMKSEEAISKRKDGRVDITFVGEVKPGKEGEEGTFRYKGFIFNFDKDLYDGE